MKISGHKIRSVVDRYNITEQRDLRDDEKTQAYLAARSTRQASVVQPCEMAEAGTLQFTIDARHVRQLGRELVADKITAVAELIKNAYDADATTITLRFAGDTDRPGAMLELIDNGQGMTLTDAQERWMRLSTDYKAQSPRSARWLRERAGQKGIGRFATETLGQHLVLTSTSEATGECLQITFDWQRLYQAGIDLSTVKNPYTVEEAAPEQHGTTLRIEALHDPWTINDLQRVARAIYLLQPPRPGTVERGDPGLTIRIIAADGREIRIEPDLDAFLDAATAVVHGTVDHKGVGRWEVTSSRFDLHAKQILPHRLLLTGSFTFHAHYFIYARAALGNIAVKRARDFGNEFGGVRVYRDDLRIMPYGEHGDDWLGLDRMYRRREYLPPIGNNAFFGEVAITREENVLLIDTASREGVIVNEAFGELRDFVRDGLIWGVLQIAAARGRKGKASTKQESPTRVELLTRVLAAAGAPTDMVATERLNTVIDEIMADVARADAQQRERIQDLIGELELLRVLASLGTSIAVFSHELKAIVNATAGALLDVEDALALEDMDIVSANVNQLRDALGKLDDLGEYIASYVSDSRRRERAPQPLFALINDFVTSFEKTVNKRGIKFEHEVIPETLRTVPMSRSQLQAVLFNLLTNAIKAMDTEGQQERRIRITARQVGSRISLRFEDTGTGVPPELMGRIFDPFVTARLPAEQELGVGTGLGLKIVRDIITAYNGDVDLTTPTAGFTTAFEVRLPIWADTV